MADWDMHYDTDSVSVTSTVASEAQDSYDVKDVLAEGLFDDGETRYLIEWEGYPLHSCTWEPAAHLDGTQLLQLWGKRRQEMGDEAFNEYIEKNITDFEEAQDRFEEARILRHEKRENKRKKLRTRENPENLTISNENDMSGTALSRERQDLTTDTPLDNFNRPNEDIDGSLFVNEISTPRRPPFEQSSSSDSGDSMDIVLESRLNRRMSQNWIERGSMSNEFAPKGNPLSKARGESLETASSSNTLETRDVLAAQHELPIRKDSGSTRATDKFQNPRARTEGNDQQVLLKKTPSSSTPNTQVEKINAVKTNTIITTTSSRNEHILKSTATTSAPSPNISTPEPPIAIKRTAKKSNPTQRIKIVNQPKTEPRKWSQGEKLFSTLKFRRLAAKRSHIEGTPDLNALDFVNARPLGLLQEQTSRDDHPYGRRETDQRTARNDLHNDPRPPPPTNAPLAWASWEVDKIPEQCFDWINGQCRFTPEQCRSLHRSYDPSGKLLKVGSWEGRVLPKYKDPPLTCHFWLRGSTGCTKPDDDCPYAHKNTGWLFIPGTKDRPGQTVQTDATEGPHSRPRTQITCLFWLRGDHGCRKSEEECPYAHRNTGWALKSFNKRDGVVKIDSSEEPFSSQIGRRQPNVSARRSSLPAPLKTCWYWAYEKCTLSDTECKFQHHDTGVIAEPPRKRGFYTANQTREAVHDQIFQSGTGKQPNAHVSQKAQATGGHQVAISQDSNLDPMHDSEPFDPPPSLPPTEHALSELPCILLKQSLEAAFDLNFSDMFSGANNAERSLLDRRAFLIYHPEEHAEELELITRWLLMHHVEVYSFWSEESWAQFKQEIMGGGSGIIIVHPDFEYFSQIPRFGWVLRNNVRLWSVGLQPSIEDDLALPNSLPDLRSDRVELFPRGGFIYITDEVFDQKPQEALKIVRLFFGKIEQLRHVGGPRTPSNRVNDACLLWRICVRPELMEHVYRQCEKYAADIDSGDPDHTSRLELYSLLSDTEYIEQDGSYPDFARPDDYFPILSERRAVTQDGYFETLERSQEQANYNMITYYAGLLNFLRHNYRHFFVVHTQPFANYVNEWRQQIGNIDEVMTPEVCIKQFEKPGQGNRFDFYEWAMPALSEDRLEKDT